MREALSIATLKTVYGRVAWRYDLQHRLLTGGADQKGRKILVNATVREGHHVLDCGSGTGTTALLAARKVGAAGRVTVFDITEAMLDVARRKFAQAGLAVPVEYRAGDMLDLPFDDGSFDVVLSTYSLCPLYDPAAGARELYRVTKGGGSIGIAHSTEPAGRTAKRMAHLVERVAWRFPSLSLGCRAVHVLPALTEAGGTVVFKKRIGAPLWPFMVLVIEKPIRNTL